MYNFDTRFIQGVFLFFNCVVGKRAKWLYIIEPMMISNVTLQFCRKLFIDDKRDNKLTASFCMCWKLYWLGKMRCALSFVVILHCYVFFHHSQVKARGGKCNNSVVIWLPTTLCECVCPTLKNQIRYDFSQTNGFTCILKNPVLDGLMH